MYVYVRVRMYAYVCACVCMYACMYVCMYVCMYGCVYGCKYVCMYLCMYAWTYVWMYVCMDVCMYVCMYVFMYLCMCIYIYVHAHIHIYSSLHMVSGCVGHYTVSVQLQVRLRERMVWGLMGIMLWSMSRPCEVPCIGFYIGICRRRRFDCLTICWEFLLGPLPGPVFV